MIFESNFTRFQGGGFLTGDVIKLKQGWDTDDWTKNAPAQVVEALRELSESDLVLRVSSVKAIRPAVNSSVDQALQVDDFHVDITQESAPGRYTGKFFTVPQHLIELNGANDTLPEVPDSLKRKDKVNVKPVEVEEDSGESQGDVDNFVKPEQQTGTFDKINKNLPDDNTTLPGATGAASYTAGYLS